MVQLESYVHKYNSHRDEINQIIKEKNHRYSKIEENMSQYNWQCALESQKVLPRFWTPVLESNAIKITDEDELSNPALLITYLGTLERVIAKRKEQIEKVKNNIKWANIATLENGKVVDNWDHILDVSDIGILSKNIKKEKENQNNSTIFEFEKFYTPDKEKQLSVEYEKALAEKCVGCDYPDPINVQKEGCDFCPNREYVDGKCVLKKIPDQVRNDK